MQRVVAPCATSPHRWTTGTPSRSAAEVCDACPLREQCLADAIRLDAAYVAGRDRYGVRGTYGGIWFHQDFHPAPPGFERRPRPKPHGPDRVNEDPAHRAQLEPPSATGGHHDPQVAA